VLWAAGAGLVIISLLAVYSSSHGNQVVYLERQLLALLTGLLGLALFAYLDYHHWQQFSPVLYVLMLLLLLVVLASGSSSSGAQRWLLLGPVSFQPSEICKLITVACLATFFNLKRRLENIWDIGQLLLLVGLPFLLVFRQPDLGTALVFIAILIGLLTASWSSPRLLVLVVTPIISILLRPMLALWLIYILLLVIILFLTRASWQDWLLVLGVNIIVGIALPFIWGMLKAYQQQRIIAFLNPEADPYGAGYHSLQSKIAIGSGGLFGKGFLHGTQTQLQFIPEQHSDFIFSAIGEEFGFIGAVACLGFFGLYVWRALLISRDAADYFGSLLAAGIAVMMTFHVLANVGMTLGLLPVVGVPLPLVSYGGSSLLMNLIALGVLQSIAMRRQKLIF
jgi:rod shape determining protein RodA